VIVASNWLLGVLAAPVVIGSTPTHWRQVTRHRIDASVWECSPITTRAGCACCGYRAPFSHSLIFEIGAQRVCRNHNSQVLAAVVVAVEHIRHGLRQTAAQLDRRRARPSDHRLHRGRMAAGPRSVRGLLPAESRPIRPIRPDRPIRPKRPIRPAPDV
jgi:hypothetical protein